MGSPLKPLKVASSVGTGDENAEKKQSDDDSGLQSPNFSSLQSFSSRQSMLNNLPVQNGDLNHKSDVFKMCKEDMRAVKKSLQRLTQSSSGLPTKSDSTAKYLSRIGDHILTIINRSTSNDVAKRRKTELWNFVAQFSKLDAEALHSIYQTSDKSEKDSSAVKVEHTENVQYKHSVFSENSGNKASLNKKGRENTAEKRPNSKVPPFPPKVSRESSPPQ